MSETIAPIPTSLVVTPDDLIERFCHVADAGDLARPTVKDGTLTCQGFCGYDGGAGDTWVVGFEDGYDFIDYLTSRGWTALAAGGRWSAEVVAAFAVEGVYGAVEYCEGDLTISQFDCEDQFRSFCQRLF
ncbi:MAG TPA: hypothetical protein VEP91_06740 [Solirubrobacterales bacterium]|nr:hypothetical protein [Solirubrobacterales bacterium]